MDLNRILYFVTVVECNSFTKAAELLDLPKSTLSRHLKTLEDSLEVRLLNRSTRKLSLTRQGHAFFEDCLPLITNLQNAKAQLQDSKDEVSGTLKITMPHDLGTGFLQYILPDFMALHPEIKLELDFSAANRDLIRDGYDLALRIGKLEDSSYIAKRLSSPRLGAYVSPGFLEKYGMPKSFEEINEFPNVLNGRNLFQLEGAEKAIGRHNGCVLSNSMIFNKYMCISGLGIGILPDDLCVTELENGTLIKVLQHQKIASPNLYAVYPSRKHLSKALKTFIDYVDNAIKVMFVK